MNSMDDYMGDSGNGSHQVEDSAKSDPVAPCLPRNDDLRESHEPLDHQDRDPATLIDDYVADGPVLLRQHGTVTQTSESNDVIPTPPYSSGDIVRTIWAKKEYFHVVRDDVFSPEVSVARLEARAKLDDPDHRIAALPAISKKLVEQESQPENAEKWKIVPKDVVYGHNNVSLYRLVYTSKIVRDPRLQRDVLTEVICKDGMSMSLWGRLKRQSFMLAYVSCTEEELRSKISDSVVNEVKALGLPLLKGIREDLVDKIIRLQLGESILACTRDSGTTTNTVQELLTLVTNDAEQRGMQVPEISPDAIKALSSIPDGGILYIGTWELLREYLRRYAIATGNEELLKRLPPNPDHGCLKFFLVYLLFGEKVGKVVTPVKVSPREEQVMSAIADLKKIIERNPEEVSRAVFDEVLDRLRGKNYSHYQHSSSKAIADGVKEELKIAFSDETRFPMIIMERVSLQALVKHHKGWLGGIVNLEHPVKVIPQNGLIIFPLLKSDKRLTAHGSWFIFGAPDVTKEHRISAVYYMNTMAHLAERSGNITPARLEKILAFLRTILLLLGFGDDSDQGTTADGHGDGTPTIFEIEGQQEDMVSEDELSQSQIVSTDCNYRFARNSVFPATFFKDLKLEAEYCRVLKLSELAIWKHS